ncbi:winged helix-turn-helix transcriptional regulator [Streptomyces chiangmaiensis]
MARLDIVRNMNRTSFENWPCSIARTMDLLGDCWTPLVLREAFYGVARFDDFRQGLGIARNTLTDRLRRLVDEGVLDKRLYQSEPRRYDYVLTEKGRELFAVLAAMSRWGDRWLAGRKAFRWCSITTRAVMTPQLRSCVPSVASRSRRRTPRCGWGPATRNGSGADRMCCAGSAPLEPIGRCVSLDTMSLVTQLWCSAA